MSLIILVSDVTQLPAVESMEINLVNTINSVIWLFEVFLYNTVKVITVCQSWHNWKIKFLELSLTCINSILKIIFWLCSSRKYPQLLHTKKGYWKFQKGGGLDRETFQRHAWTRTGISRGTGEWRVQNNNPPWGWG